MPKIVCYALTWSPVHHVYELHERQGHEALDIVPESQARLIWSSQISSFAFHGKHGSYTVRKERKQRGGEYWCAYARIGWKLTKRYVGRAWSRSRENYGLLRKPLCGRRKQEQLLDLCLPPLPLVERQTPFQIT